MINTTLLAGKTAIRRSKLSRPMQYLKTMGALQDRVLDYGCGHGDDVRALRAQGNDIIGYDPVHCPLSVVGVYDVITCNYVLNVIQDPVQRAEVLQSIGNRLAQGGRAYITVRDDLNALKGVTRKGTWQGKVELDLPIEKHVKGAYVMYRLT